MSEITQIFITSFLTVLGGVIVFTTGQIVVKFIIEPYQNYRKLVGEIADTLIYFANVTSGLDDYYFASLENAVKMEDPRKELVEARLKEIITNNWNRADEGKRTLRKQASLLMSITNQIPKYRLWEILGLMPKRNEIKKASENLIGLSNSSDLSNDNVDRRSKIAECLKIKL